MSENKGRRSLIALVDKMREGMETSELDAETRELGRRILRRSERVLSHLEGASETLERAAKLQLSLLHRMVPIVEDLGELMRHTLDDARERRGLSPSPKEVIDVKSDES